MTWDPKAEMELAFYLSKKRGEEERTRIKRLLIKVSKVLPPESRLAQEIHAEIVSWSSQP